jgi:hypothetical protein
MLVRRSRCPAADTERSQYDFHCQRGKNGADGCSDIEGKATRVGASECGQRTSFNESHYTDEGGRANLVELEVTGPTPIEGLNLRLYNRGTHKWSLNFASSKAGTLGTPTVGEFKNGRGEFFDQENFNGRPVLVRFIISDIKTESCKFEQSFSTDGGKTWEVNWIAIDTRVKE